MDLWNGKGLESKVVPPGVEPRASGLSCQCSATELQHPPTATPLSRSYDSIEVIVWMNACSYLLCMVVGVSNLWADQSWEESDEQDSSMVRRLIMIASNQRHKSGLLLSMDLWNSKGLERRWCHRESNPGHTNIYRSIEDSTFMVHKMCLASDTATLTQPFIIYTYACLHWSWSAS